jgi:hypothetical protein
MTIDKKEYQAVEAALLSYSTLPVHINRFSKIFVETEDASLKKLLAAVVRQLKLASLNQSKGVASLRIQDSPYKELADYSQRCLASVKPQWQLIAEQHGWQPPA